MSVKGREKAMKDKAMIGDSGYDRIEADHYATPPENLDCLLEHITLRGDVWEPACGEGNLVRRLEAFGHRVWSTDLHDYGLKRRFFEQDFLTFDEVPGMVPIHAIITNPPYETVDTASDEWAYLKPIAERYGMRHPRVSLAELFCRHAIALMKPIEGQVAMFMRNEFDCSRGRLPLFSNPPFQKKIVVAKRPRWIVGSKGSPRHNYAWFVWDWKHVNPQGFISYSHPDDAPGPVEKAS